MERKTKVKELGKPKVKKEKDVPPTKVIIRRLPPSWTEEVCLEQISPLPDHDFFYFSKADISLGQFSFSRAYINFENQADILNFRDKFDGYVFVDAQGNEYVAVVELAVFQKIPRKKVKRVDPKKATIEEDPDYVKFLAALEEEDSTGQVNVESLLEEIEARQGKAKEVQSTPLIEYLKRKKDEKMQIQMYYSKQRDDRKRKEVDRRRQRDEERRRRRERDQLERQKEKERRDRLAKKKKEKELAGKEKEDGSEHPLKKSSSKDSASNLGELEGGVEGLQVKEKSPPGEAEESKATSPAKARTEDSKRDWREDKTEKEDRRERRDREPPRSKKEDFRPKDRGPRDRDRDRPPRSAREYDKGPKEKAKPSSYSARRDKEKERRDKEKEKRDAGRFKKEPEEATFSLPPPPSVSTPSKSYGEESRAPSRVSSDSSRSAGDTAPGPADLGAGDRAGGASGSEADKDDKKRRYKDRPERAIYIPRRARERLEKSGVDKS